ncbi:cupin domain-containing protein [Streptococcus sciuri]|uniref:Cupin domain-containing protein n=1 Tax=Streptococcus sciuri TaxID=2973939 RepID=A0ABT2F8N1_9STRE|nr:cupin domain-containing protein [Streptococcus sciuri]MCS4488779.1 cupin domain-containing protein [Streptococcus sciuri]
MKYQDKATFDQFNYFGQGESNDAYSSYFIGQSYLKALGATSNQEIALTNVTFEPGCRNNWHIHKASRGGGQILICTAGEGWYQEEGKPAMSLKEGTVVIIPANVKHWHGAKSDSWFSHIALGVPGEDTENIWLEEVSDEAYLTLKD